MTDRMWLAESLSERLCHDLSGLVGTVASLLELATEAPEDSAEVIATAHAAAVVLAARLRLLRGAWVGVAGPLDAAGLLAMVPGLPGGERLALDIGGLAMPMAPAVARIVLNLLLVAATGLPAGGQISLHGDEQTGVLTIIAGSLAAWPIGFAGLVADPALAEAAMMAEPSSRIQPPLAVLLTQAAGMRLSWLLAPGQPGRPAPLLLQSGA